MPDIFDEVEEELRSERIKQFFARYGLAMVIVAVVIVLGIGGWRYHAWQLARADQAAAAQYMIASNAAAATGKNAAKAHEAAAGALAELAQNAPAGYRTLARLRAAALAVEHGKQAEALHLYDAVAADPDADPLLRGLAGLLWAQRQIDTGDPSLLRSRLVPLAAPGSPWRPLAEQDLALLDIRQKHPDAARKRLRPLASDKTAPRSVRETAALLLDGLGRS